MAKHFMQGVPPRHTHGENRVKKPKNEKPFSLYDKEMNEKNDNI